MVSPPDDERGEPDSAGPGSASLRAAGTPLPPEHVGSAWRSWLSALSTDAEAAMAAALAYESLPPEARDAWLDALATDSVAIDVPAVALYAPLLAVEQDGSRRGRIERAIAADPAAVAFDDSPQAARGVDLDGTHACVIVAPLYLDFVQVLVCRYTPSGGFVAVRHDPLRHTRDVPPVREVEGIPVEVTPLQLVVEDLAHAILADRRRDRETPQALTRFAHLFTFPLTLPPDS